MSKATNPKTVIHLIRVNSSESAVLSRNLATKKAMSRATITTTSLVINTETVYNIPIANSNLLINWKCFAFIVNVFLSFLFLLTFRLCKTQLLHIQNLVVRRHI